MAITISHNLEKTMSQSLNTSNKIERVSNWSFIIVYLDSSLRPSHRAFITYVTGNKPFTYSLIGRIMEIPKDLPPIVNCSGRVHQNVCRLPEEK